MSDGSVNDLHQVLDTNGFPTAYPLYAPTIAGVHDGVLTQACGLPTTRPGLACGDRAVNTVQPFYQPYSPGTPDALRLPPPDDRQTAMTVGDRLGDAKVSWAWYAGGWDNAAGNVDGRGWTNGDTPGTCTDPATNPAAVYPNCPDQLFQFHHQPFVYYDRYAPGTRARSRHLRDEKDFSPRCGVGTCARSASLSRSVRRASTPATPVSTAAAITSSRCSRPSRAARRLRTRWSSLPMTSSAASGTTSRRRGRARRQRDPTTRTDLARGCRRCW